MGLFLPLVKQQQELSRLPIAFWVKPNPFAWSPGSLHHHPTLLCSHLLPISAVFSTPNKLSSFPQSSCLLTKLFLPGCFLCLDCPSFQLSAFWDSNHPSRSSSKVSPSVKASHSLSKRMMLRVCAPDTFNITTSNPWATIKQVLNVCWALGQNSSMHQCLS